MLYTRTWNHGRILIFAFIFVGSCRAPRASGVECMEESKSTACMPDTIAMKVQFLSPINSCSASSNRRASISSSGLRYRNLGKSGLRVSNIGFGKLLDGLTRISFYRSASLDAKKRSQVRVEPRSSVALVHILVYDLRVAVYYT